MMLGQTFQYSDIAQLAGLCFIEILLSVDNAIILAVLIQPLPQILRKKALFIGLSSAFIFRALAIFTVSIILSFKWLELIGGCYLLFLALHHFYKKISPSKSVKPYTSFWKTVFLIEFLDLAFALDSIIAGVGFIATPTIYKSLLHPKLWIVYTGGILGLIAIRFSAGYVIKILDRFPRMKDTAYYLVGWIGIKLAIEVLIPPIPHFQVYLWTIFSFICLAGLLKKR